MKSGDAFEAHRRRRGQLMSPNGQEAIVAELAASFGAATDVSPDKHQPLTWPLFPSTSLPGGWQPSPTRALAVLAGWPNRRPAFYIDTAVVNADGQPPRSNHLAYVLGEAWQGFSWTFPWTVEISATGAVQRWLARFRETT